MRLGSIFIPTKVLVILLSLSQLVVPALAQECASDGTCDKHERCSVWKEEGECRASKEYMMEYCPVTCKNLLQKEFVNQNDDELDGMEETDDPTECKDQHVRCPMWVKLGECEKNPSDMHTFCKKSCGICGGSGVARDPNAGCKDSHVKCPGWAAAGECEKNAKYMTSQCQLSCGTCPNKVPPPDASTKEKEEFLMDQTLDFGERQKAEGGQKAETIAAIKDSIEYMKNEDTLSLNPKLLSLCMNQNELCTFWAILGECEKNRSYMTVNCAPACKSCHLIDIGARCPKLEDAKPALKPGDLNKMFERILLEAPGNRTLTESDRQELAATGMTEYTVHIHSRPDKEKISDTPSKEEDLATNPWIISFDNFLTNEECDALIDLGFEYGYKRSQDVGGLKADGTHTSVNSTGRTSENAWCAGHGGCRQRELPQLIHNRMSRVMQIPANNSEDLQILKYEKTQFYNTHHDYIEHQRDRQCGPRILTFFLYLSDVEEGGGTNFPKLDFTMKPKKGAALLWPSYFNSSPLDKDGRTTHGALPVLGSETIKYAANGWIHMFDYVGPQSRGCS